MILSELREGKLLQTEITAPVFEMQYDVVVAGLGTAGGMAAIFSAENGLKTLGIESFNCVGGTTTISGVDGHYFGIEGGRYTAVDDAVLAFQKAHTKMQMEARILAQEEIILRSGAAIWYDSLILGVYLENNTVVGIKALTPKGIVSVACSVLMDCTGEGTVAHLAGCASAYGRELDGFAQPYSMVTTVFLNGHYYTTNCDFGRVDQRNDKALSDALIFSRGEDMVEARNNASSLLQLPLIGIREGRRIETEENASLKDFFADKYTDKPILYAYADLDKHGWDIAFDSEELCDWTIGANMGAINVLIPIPMGAIIPKTIDGLLVPCRAFGVDRDIESCARMVPNMKKLAEVAADLALLAKEKGCALRCVPYGELKARLEKTGCLCNPYDSYYRVDGVADPVDLYFIENTKELEKALATDKPGWAIWSAKRMGDRAKPALIPLVKSEDENTRKHAAFALAMLGDDSGVGVLRQMLAQRDGTTLADCRKLNQQRGCMAIYLLGKLGDTESVDALLDVLTDPNELDQAVYHMQEQSTRYAVLDFNSAYFQFASNAVMALIRIGDKHPDCRAQISTGFQQAFGDGSYYTKITTKPVMSSEGGMAENLKAVAFAASKRWAQ